MSGTELTNLIRRLRFDHGEMTQKELARIARVFGAGVEDVFQYNEEPSDQQPAGSAQPNEDAKGKS